MSLLGRLIMVADEWPELGSSIVVKLSHGWYHGTLEELDASVLVATDCVFRQCLARVQDPLYPSGEPQEPTVPYDCVQWGRATWPATRHLTHLIRTRQATKEMMGRAMELGLEHIVGVAVRCGANTYHLSWPARHHMIVQMLTQTASLNGEYEQGFWTSSERYCSRREAAILARDAGQTVVQRPQLFSEDLW